MSFKAKKSLGQNFLIDQNIITKILNIVDFKNRNVLEVGPGTGNLTKQIFENKPLSLTIIEKDEVLFNNLLKTLDRNINIINFDILKYETNNFSNKNLIVFGNLPYNISTEILCNWILKLGNEAWFSDLVLMFQKEVADRIIAQYNTKNYGRLSIISQWRLDIEKKFDISPKSFNPIPKIDSSVLHFKIKKEFFAFNKPKTLEIITRIFFNQRRKMIKNPLKQLFPDIFDISKKLNLDLSLRPQNLPIETYFKLTKEYENLRN